MILNFKKKEEVVYKLQKKFETAFSAVVASIYGIEVNLINKLRKESRRVGVYIRFAPNSLLRRAVLNTPCECLSNIFVGNSIVAFSIKNPSDAARIFIQFSRENSDFKIKGAVFENKFIQSDQVNILSNLPGYDESIIRLISVLKMSSIGKLINILKVLFNQEVKL